MTRFEINADLGEHEDGGQTDSLLMPWIQRANIACGGHAGNAQTMRLALALAKDHGVLAGAHPSHPDRAGFGRQPSSLPIPDLMVSLEEQVTQLLALAAEIGVRLDHVKPHGALYNRAARDPELAAAVVRSIQSIDPELALLGLAHGAMAEAAATAGLRFIPEAFIDRAYEPDGHLRPRTAEGAVLTLAQARTQARYLRDGYVVASDGQRIPIRAESFCVHGDGPEAASMLAALASPDEPEPAKD